MGVLVVILLLDRTFIYFLCLMTLFVIYGWKRHLKPFCMFR